MDHRQTPETSKNVYAEDVRVVIADDSEPALAALKTIVSQWFQVIGTARDGEELLSQVDLLRPDVVVSDISMPVLDGIEAVRRLSARHSSAPVVLVSVHSERDIVRRGLDAGASGYVFKPAAGEDLPTAIREVLQHRVYVSPTLGLD